MKDIKFSIIVVCLNEEQRIGETIQSILSQTYKNIEIIVKDGCSADDTIKNIPDDNRIKIFTEKDTSVYDGMNQAIKHITGDYVMFLNCGDLLYDNMVLKNVAEFFNKNNLNLNSVIYGDYCKDGKIFKQCPKIDKLYLLEAALCHQSIFMGRAAVESFERFDTSLKICADYDSIVKTFLNGTRYCYIDMPVCVYAGGGISETGNAINQVKIEGKLIRKKYFSFVFNILYYLIRIKKRIVK